MAENSQPLQMANDGKIKKWFSSKLKSRTMQKTNKQENMVQNETENVTIKPVVYIAERFKAMLQGSIQTGKRPLRKL